MQRQIQLISRNSHNQSQNPYNTQGTLKYYLAFDFPQKSISIQFTHHNPSKMYQNNHEEGDISLYKNTRNKFVTRVYSIVSLQLLATTAVVALAMYNSKFAMFQQQNMWAFWVSLALSIISLIALVFSEAMSKGFPINVILLSVFTACESYLVSMICQMYTPETVLLSAVATCAVTFGLTFYAITTKSDFTSMSSAFRGGFSAVFWLVLSVSLVNMFWLRSSPVNTFLAIIVGMIYCVYLIIDTQMILGGGKKQLALDNYVMGAAIIYMDIINLFLKLLQILGKKKDD